MTVLPLDIVSAIISAILAFLLIGTLIAVGIGFALYKAFQSLDENQRIAILAALVVGGILLTISVIGIEIGTLMILSAVFFEVFQALGGHTEGEHHG